MQTGMNLKEGGRGARATRANEVRVVSLRYVERCAPMEAGAMHAKNNTPIKSLPMGFCSNFVGDTGKTGVRNLKFGKA